MFRSIRYQNPVIREHLASQYAMGLLTPLVKKRVEKLIIVDVSFKKEVVEWQERLVALNDIAKPVVAPKFVKQNVMSRLSLNTDSPAAERKSILSSLLSTRFWQGMSFASLALCFGLALQLLYSPQLPSVGPLSYIAYMGADASSNEASLVVSAYGKTEDSPSRLQLYWNDRLQKQNIAETSLWAVERETGTVTRLSQLDQGVTDIALNAGQWLAVKNSLELVIVKGDEFDGEVVFRGPCVQLTSWEVG